MNFKDWTDRGTIVRRGSVNRVIIRLHDFLDRYAQSPRWEGGVGFAIKTSLLDRIEFSSSVIDRIMNIWVQPKHDRHATRSSIYAPTLQAIDEVLDSTSIFAL